VGRNLIALLGAVALYGFLSATAQAQVVALGASNTAGKGIAPQEAYPAQLEAMLRAKGYNGHVVNAGLAGCGKSRDFGKTVMKRARNGNSGLIKSTGYEGAKGDESGWKHHRPTFSAAC